jgi:hypothetical protein
VKISSGAEFAAHDARLYSRFHLFALRMALPRSAEMNTQAFDIAIRHARLRGSADRYADIGIKDGRVAAIARVSIGVPQPNSTPAAIWRPRVLSIRICICARSGRCR